MKKYTVIHTKYRAGEVDVVTAGLSLGDAIKKVSSNIYGYDHNKGLIEDLIANGEASESGANFFCSKNTGQISIRLELA